MQSRLYAMLPDAAVQWEKRKIQAGAMLLNAISEQQKESIREYFGLMFNQRRPMTFEGGVATIHVHDFLSSGVTFVEKCLGATDYGDLAAEIRVAKSSPDVKAVLLDVDSGGGSAVGCVEIGKMVSELALEKETALFTNGMCCSAAYCVGVGAARRYASPSAMVGSIGTILTFFDFEELLTRNGISAHIITSEGADLKASGNQYRKPTDEEIEHLQGLADEYAEQFTSHVWDNNAKIDAEEGFRGQAVSGRQAVNMGFVDGIATRDEVLAGLKAWATFDS